jgi:uncharacterized protein (TIGR03118 family)
VQHNLVSDVPGLADQTEPTLINPWGIGLNSSGGLWISNNHSGTSTLYNGSGQPFPAGNPLIVSISGKGSAPTGQVFNGTPAFEIAPGQPALFIFATESGTIFGWNPAVDIGSAKLVADRSGSGDVYKGLALGRNASGPLLYAANFSMGTIDVFDSGFQPVTVTGGFAIRTFPPASRRSTSRESAAIFMSPTLFRMQPSVTTPPGPATDLLMFSTPTEISTGG